MRLAVPEGLLPILEQQEIEPVGERAMETLA